MEINEIMNYYSIKVANSIHAMLAYWDSDQVCRFANQACSEWFGKKSEDMIDKITIKEFLGPLYRKSLPYLKKAYKGKIQVFERTIPTSYGDTIYSVTTYMPDIVDGKVKGIIAYVSDVTYLKKIEKQLQEEKAKAEEMAMHDFLTGLPNRAFLHERILKGISMAQRKGTMTAIFLIDMDNFKSINDTFGHLTGDDVLVETAKRLNSAVRKYDTVSRVGGDEFAVLSVEIEKKGEIEELAARFLNSARMPITIKNSVICPLFSIGIAVYPENGKTIEELFKKADIALYKSKESGKNCYNFSS